MTIRSSPTPGTPGMLDGVLGQLHHHGAVSLPGSWAGATARWLRRRRILMGTMFGISGTGVLTVVLGLALRNVGVWALLIPLGSLLAFVGLMGGAIAGLLGRLMRDRLGAERQPVLIDQQGVTLRGIGPLPWRFLGPPARLHVRVKNDIGGACTLMPLTPEGHRVVNAQAGPWRALVGPRPYLRTEIPYLLLPGIEGLSEDEVVQLFQYAHERYAR